MPIPVYMAAVAGIPSEWNLSLCPLAVDELNNHCRGSARQHLLDSDIRKLGSAVGKPGEGVNNKSAVMRDNVARQIEKATVVEDPSKGGGVLLQLIKATDISKPAAASATYEASKAAGGGGGKRVLLLQATDGTQKVSCLEVDKVDALNLGLPPGTKLLLDSTTEVMNGQVLLRPNKVKVLGGTVERLVEAWKANKLAAESRFGSAGESTRARDANSDGPPKFVSFADRNKMHKRQNMKAAVTTDTSSSSTNNGPSAAEPAPTARFTREELGESTVPQAAVPEIAKVSKDAFKSKYDHGQGSARRAHVGKHTRRNEARALEAEYSRPSAGGASLGAYINLRKSDDMAAAMLLSEEEALPPEPPRQSYGGKGKGRYNDDHYQPHKKGKGGKHGGKGSHSKGGGKGGGGKGHSKGGRGGKGKGRW
ncbi:hypothetical protein FOL47_002771 [Perkinsus chesapeaki]|uniref:RecQ mediated genome instability protein 1 OB-fold domain-containing protein n=1 Tax=Perkinsus chesapeaki TaxID=330153 RepID=A0A7J6N002_PERCH|nr:hypothetical protein FOL47_002771 [Perkinsus chesapeaki]